MTGTATGNPKKAESAHEEPEGRRGEAASAGRGRGSTARSGALRGLARSNRSEYVHLNSRSYVNQA